MNKIVLALLATICISMEAVAGPQVSLSTGVTKNLSGATSGTESDSYSLRIANDLNDKGLNVDFITIQNRNTTSLSLNNQYEIGLAQRIPLNSNVIPYVRAGIGSFMPSTRNSQNYVLIEPGVVVRANSIPVFAKLDYAWGTGLNTDALDVTLGRVAIGYNFTKEVSVSVRRDYLRGDMKQDMTWLQLGYRF